MTQDRSNARDAKRRPAKGPPGKGGKPPHGKPPHGKSPYAKSTSGKPAEGKPASGKPPQGTATQGKASYGKTPRTGPAPAKVAPEPRIAPKPTPVPLSTTPPSADGDGDRVAKALARAGVASRREVERLIEAGRVALNGHVLTTPAVKINPGDILTVDGAVVSDAEPTRLFRYHKPVGLVTTHLDPKGRPTVFSALPAGLPRLISVGRLDLSSEGLLLLTNDGALTRALELPSNAWVRRYRARCFGHTTQEKLDKLKDGITVEGVHYGSIEARVDKAKEGQAGGSNIWITVTLAEGKNREIRRVLEAVGLKVNRLLRLSYGPFVLGDLAQGQVEEVGPRVIRELLADHISPANMPKGDGVLFKTDRGATPGRRTATAAARIAAASAASGLDPAIDDTVPRAPGGKRPRSGKPGGKGRGAAAEPEAKKVYKSGWAKPKIKPSAGHAPPKPKPAGGRPKTDPRPPTRPGGGPKRRG